MFARGRSTMIDKIEELEKEISEAKGWLGDCFDGIEPASLATMIQSAGGAFAHVAQIGCEDAASLRAANARVAELEKREKHETRMRERMTALATSFGWTNRHRGLECDSDAALDWLEDDHVPRVVELGLELSKRKGIRYPDFRPDDKSVQVWTFWKPDFGPKCYQWITRNRCSLVEGEYWRVLDDSAPDQNGEGG